jgi:nucleotide-binding universal stress UspA family protein
VRPTTVTAELTSEVLPRLVLIPLDGSPVAEQMIRPAVELGKLSRAGFTLLRVVKPIASLAPLPVGETSMSQMATELAERLRTVQDELRKEAVSYLETKAGPLRGEGLHVMTRVAFEEQPALGVLNEAEAGDAGLIALATHGRRGLARLVLGGVSDKVVRGARSLVLLCSPKL